MPVQRNFPHQRTDDQSRVVSEGSRHGAPEAGPAMPVRTRTGAVWFGICIGALVLVALIIFMLQNTTSVEVAFLGARGSAPLALVALIAGVGVGIVALVIGSLRIGQLRRRLRQDRLSSMPGLNVTP